MELCPLPAAGYERALPLLADLEIYLTARAVVACGAPGAVYVDDPTRPRRGLICAGHRFHLAGDARDPGFVEALRTLFREKIYPKGQAAGKWGVTLYHGHPSWLPALEQVLAGRPPLAEARHYYAFDAATGHLPRDWRDQIPAGFHLRPVDRALLAEDHLDNLDHLREEMASECPSAEFFLDHRFGLCLVHEDTVAAWCLSEYNCGHRCEVGIETTEPYRRRGLGRLTTWALIAEALARGIRHVGWHTSADNVASAATALSAGLQKRAEYTAHYLYFDPALHLAVRGNVSLRRERHAEALAWYRRAFEAGGAPAWAYANAAAARAELDDHEGAMDDLHRALDAGFADAEYLQTSPRFERLRRAAAWSGLLARLQD